MQVNKHPIIEQEAIDLVERVIRSGSLSGFRGSPSGHAGGTMVKLLEYEFRKYFDIKHALSMNSATACLHAACIACGIGVGDEVIVTPYSFASSATCVLMAGATPVFADIEPDTFCLDPVSVEEHVTWKTKAIIPVHLCGHPANMDAIMDIAERYDLKVIEDAAQSIGATYNGKYAGTIGDCGVFSFNQSKHISTGEGGMLITDDDKIARIVMAVRNHGEVSDPDLNIIGYNYRMCEVEAVLALSQFSRLDEMNQHRIGLCNYISGKLPEGLIPPVTHPWCKHVFYTYAVKYDGTDRDAFQDKLIKKGVYFGKGYVKPLHLLPVFNGVMGDCPVAERMYLDELMVTDIFRYPMTVKDVDKIVKVINEVIKEVKNG